MAIKNIVFDYDGTCTQIPEIYKQYLERYLIEFNKRVFPPGAKGENQPLPPVSPQEWQEAQKIVSEHSPKAGWTIATTSSAPAAADPYIMAFESAKLILRNRKFTTITDPPFEAHKESNEAHEAPWRDEARSVFEGLLKKNINVYFISNSSSRTITRRLTELLEVSVLPKGLKVQSDAAKFRISELNLQQLLPADAKTKFEALPAVHTLSADGRPVHLRRGNYLSAICAVLDNGLSAISETVFCGDIWEMDLAMPFALGGNIHLIERAAPFETYAFEKEAVLSSQGKISIDLNGLLEWI